MYSRPRGRLRPCPVLPTRWSSAIDILKRRQLEEQRDLEALRDLESGSTSAADTLPPPDAPPSPHSSAVDGE
jgi:hypothetical protein